MKKLTLEVEVTKEILKEAEDERDYKKTYKVCTDCVIAKAIKEALIQTEYKNHVVEVGYNTCSILPLGTDAYTPSMILLEGRLPLKIHNYICEFDQGISLEPTKFFLTLEEPIKES